MNGCHSWMCLFGEIFCVTEQKVQKTQVGKCANPSIAQRRRFLLHLAVALHSYGSSSSRTEYLIDRAADRLDVDTSIAVFPNLVLLSFNGEGSDLNRQTPHLVPCVM